MHTHRLFAIAALWGGLGIALGAFGAHALPGIIESRGLSPEVAGERLDLFEKAVRYQMYAALAASVFALAGAQRPARGWSWACGMLLAGSAIFCGVLYGLTFAEGPLRAVLGMSAPVGGSLMIAGWLAATWTAWRVKSSPGHDA